MSKCQREIFHRRLLTFVLLNIIVFAFTSTYSFAQWKKIFDVGYQIRSVYFKEFDSIPLQGFLSIDDKYPASVNRLWRTVDGGKSWTMVPYPLDNIGYLVSPSCFTFNNSLIGWWCPWKVGADVYQTADGGASWNQSIQNTFVTSIYYHSLTDQLIISGGSRAGSAVTLGIAFSDSNHGIITGGNVSPVQSRALYTNDGTLSWHQSSQLPEQFQPMGIKGTTTFYALTEQNSPPDIDQTGSLFRSDDGGMTWKKVYQYHDHEDYRAVTGTLQYNFGGIYFQTVKDGSEGIMMSSDSGKTFFPICGPSNESDTRFYVRDSFMYAGDRYGGVWLNTTGIGSNSTLQLSSNEILFSPVPQCTRADSIRSVTFFDSCSGIQAKLTNVSISGSNNFSVTFPSTIPRTIHPNDSLIVSYDPQTSQPDTGLLHLRFHLGWKDFDTIIQLFGAGRIFKENVKFNSSLSKSAAAAGEITDLNLKPNRVVSGRGLQRITFDLNYIGDLLNTVGSNSLATSIPGATIVQGAKVHLGRIETLPIAITGNDMLLDPSRAIANIKFQVMMTDTTSSAITVTNLKLNDGDSVFENCILSADSSNAYFNLLFFCSDSAVYKYIRTGVLPQIKSIRPNPAQDQLEIDLQSTSRLDVTIEIFDGLGTKVFSDVRSISEGSSSIHLDTKDFSPGMYVVRVGGASQSFVKTR